MIQRLLSRLVRACSPLCPAAPRKPTSATARSARRGSRQGRHDRWRAEAFRAWSRSLGVEALESRQLLSVTLGSISNQTLLAGAPLNLALAGSSSAGNTVSYTVAVTNSTLANPSVASPQLATTVPQGNPSLKIAVSDPGDGISGDVTLQLFKDLAPNTVDKVLGLVNQGFYKNLTFHRIISDFMIQGGDPIGNGTGGPGFKFDSEIHPDLRFTSPGVLAMANSGPDTNGSQFFITVAETRWLDFRYNIFGFVTKGLDIVDSLSNVGTNVSTNRPNNTVTMTSVTTFTDTQNGVLRLSAPVGTTGAADVTVTARDAVTGETAQRTFRVTVSADSTVEQPFLSPISSIQTTANTPVTVTIPTTNVSGAAITYSGSVSPANSNLAFSVNSATGQATLTPSNGVTGVFSVQTAVTLANPTSTTTADTQLVPVYVNPVAPTVDLDPASDTGASDSDNLTLLNNTSNNTLKFNLGGLVSGADVKLFADGTLIGQAAATGATMALTTNGTFALSNGSHAITATQTLKNQAVNVGNLSTTTDLASPSSSVLTLTVANPDSALTGNNSLSGYVYVDVDNDGKRVTPGGVTHLGLAGITVRLFRQDNQAWTEVSGKSPIQTGADGSYSFSGLNAGTYEIRETPPVGFLDGKTTAGSLGGTVSETAGQSHAIQVQLTGNQAGTDYNFAVWGLEAARVTARVTLASSPTGAALVRSMHAAPVVSLAGSASTAGYTTGAAGVAVASGSATITSADSPTLVSMTVKIQGVQDGAAEQLTATTTGTPIVSAFSNATLSLTGVADVSVYQTVLRSVKYANTAVPGHAGVRTISVTVDDGTVASAAATSTVTVAQGTAGSYSITVDRATYNLATATSAGFTLAGAQSGSTYRYEVSSSGGGTKVSGSGAVTSTTQNITGIDLSGLPDGALTFSVTVTDTQGSEGAPATATAALDKTPPAGYSISATPGALNSTNAAAAGFTLAGAQVGAAYHYTIGSSGGGTAVTGSGNVTTAAQSVSGINVTGLGDGTLTFSVTLTDTAGNVGPAVTTTATLDRAAPGSYSITPQHPVLNAATAVSTGFTFAGAQVGATYHYSIGSSGGGTAVTGNGTIASAAQSVTGINVSGLPDGTLTYQVTLTDPQGNAGTPVTATAALDKTLPAGYSVTPTHAVLSATTAASTGFTLAGAQVGAAYQFTINSSGGGTAVTGSGSVTTATQSVSGINVSGLGDGTLTFSVILTDAAGNSGAAATAAATLDKTPPAGYSITANQTLLNATTAASTGFTFAAAEVGSTYQYSISSSGGGTTVNNSGSVTAATQSVSGINVSGLGDGTLTFSVVLTDAAGNSGAAATASATLDKTAPAGYSITPTHSALNATTAASTGFTLAGAQLGATYQYTIGSSGGGTAVTGNGNVASATQSVSGINVSGLGDGTLTFSVILTDAAGNSGAAATAAATLDKTPPTGYSITANQGLLNATTAASTGFTFAAAEIGSAYQYSIASSGGGTNVTGAGSITSATQQVTGLNLASLPDGTLTFSVALTDPAGNGGATATTTALLVKSLAITSTPATSAKVGVPYSYTVTTNAPAGDAVTVTPGALPAGMTFDGPTQTFTWTPTADQAGASPSFAATVGDAAGNQATLGPVFIAVQAANGLTVVSPPASLAIGSPVLVAANSTNAGTPAFHVETSDPKVTATLMPSANRVLRIVTDHGVMEFQLLDNYTPRTADHFADLVNAGTYTDTSFYRVIETFMIQGGAGGVGDTMPVELNADLRFSTSGLLAMANNGVDGNSSEFFVTNPNDTRNGFLDFRYTIFGKLIKGNNVRQAIAATPVTANSSGENSQPLTEPKILSMSIVAGAKDAVVMLKAAAGASGSYTVTVSDGLGASQTFTVGIGTNAYDPPNPWVVPINDTDRIFTAAGTPATFTPQGVSADGTAVQVSVQVFRAVPAVPGAYVDDSYTSDNPPADATNPNITLSSSGSSYTVTPTAGYYGVQVLEVMARSATPPAWVGSSGVDPVYRAFVPVFIAPPAPTVDSVSVNGVPVSGSTPANNSSAATALSFHVSGVVAGAAVSLYLDGGTTPIATGTVAANATTIVLTTDGSTTIPNGSHQFSVQQTIATDVMQLFAGWYVDNDGYLNPGSIFQIPSRSLSGPASAGTAITISA